MDKAVDENDEEENEIQLLILNNKQHFKDGNFRKLTLSSSAHANLSIFKHHSKQKNFESTNRLNVEDKRDSFLQDNVNNFGSNFSKNSTIQSVEEDSDEEFFTDHVELRPLRKSKSAYADFHGLNQDYDNRFYTKPLLSKIVGKDISSGEEVISELIDLPRGDILQFRIAQNNISKYQVSEERIDCDQSCLPDRTLVISPESHSLCDAESWSAPAYTSNTNKALLSPDPSELDEINQEFFGNMNELMFEADNFECRKESSWSAPEQFNFISNESDNKFGEVKYFNYCQEEMPNSLFSSSHLHKQEVFYDNELKENLTNIIKHERNDRIETDYDKNELIPMVDDDNLTTFCNFPLIYGGYLSLPPGQRCHSIFENSILNTMSSSVSSYSDDNETEISLCKRLSRQQLLNKSATMRLCRRGSPPFAQIDLLSESEISDLEQQIASGRLIKQDINKDELQPPPCNTIDFPADSKVMQEKISYRLTQSDSALTINKPKLLRHFPARSVSSEFCKKPNQNTLSTNQNKTSVTQLDFDTNSSLTFNNIPSVNTLPKREHLSLSFTSCSTTRRQLPRTPSPEDPLIEIISNASRERILNVLRQTHKLLRQGQEAENRNSIFSRMNCPGNFDDNNLLKNNNTPVLPFLPSPSIFNSFQTKWPPSSCRVQALADDKQYTLSYGMDQSANISSRRRRRIQSIEGSYYEDTLQTRMAANNPAEVDYGFISAREDDQFANDLVSPSADTEGYIFADGARSSSGISSSCHTSSSRSCELPDYEKQVKTTSRARRFQPCLDNPMAPTHRVQFQFVPRHSDELRLDRGDALHVDEKFNDHWCFGMNLRSGQRGIFPEAHIIEIDLVDEICSSVLPEKNRQINADRDTFYLTMLASVEVAHHKGNDILTQAINKVCSVYQKKDEILVPQTVLMEISFRGIHVIDKRKKDIFRCPAFDYFYSLQNISFCGAHPKELRYFGFITKHPILPRFACHVFLSNESTQPIVEAIGRAFKRSYDEYMAFAHPTEDIFLDE
ncbi:JNK-interacting protein 1 [Meloidogyne graminicola]|uniref:JNK-interacting protein 1 n=1 Tax=Meloidogyne graminicola TaxID=189291 RepID=A0A8S9ZG68_9BILA|nr:JNK-interacting protein 1 [Meloidogyne graminicola]